MLPARSRQAGNVRRARRRARGTPVRSTESQPTPAQWSHRPQQTGYLVTSTTSSTTARAPRGALIGVRAGIASTATMLLLAAAVLGGASASAAPASPSPSPPAPIELTIDATPAFSGSRTLPLTGDAAAGESVTLTSPGASSLTVTATTDNRWSGTLQGLSNGQSVVITATSGDQTETREIAVLGPPDIDVNQTREGVFGGSGLPGATVAVQGLGGAKTATVTSSGRWEVSFSQDERPAGQATITATQTARGQGWPPNSTSNAATRQASISWTPQEVPSPAFTSPASGARITGSPVQVAGTGVDGATVSVFADNGSGSCTATVSGGRWSCAVPVAGEGTITFYASQALVPSRPSQPGTLSVALALGGVGGADEDDDEAEEEPGPSATPTPEPDDGASPTPIPGIDADDGDTGAGRQPIGPIERSLGTGWGIPTGFGFMLPDARSVLDPIRWVTAIALAIAFVLFVALPLRLLFAALQRRFHVPRLHLTGRNQNVPAEADADGPPLKPRTLAAVTLAGSAAVIAIAWGVDAQPSSLRLLVAVGIGLVLLNLLAVALPAWIGRARLGLSIEARTLPFLVLVGAVLALISRGFDLDPPIITGVIGTFAFVAGESRSRRVAVNLGQFGTIFLVSIAAWWAHALVGPGLGAERILLREVLATMVLAGVGSLVVLALPVRGLPGRMIYDWSRPVWIGTAGTSVVLAALMLLGDLGTTHFPALLLGILAACFGGLCVLVWAWFRFAHEYVRGGRAATSRG